MVQIIPQDVGLAARIAQGVLPPLGEGFQQGAERGIDREQGLKEREQQRQIDMQAALEQEKRQRQMNLDAMQESGIANQYPGLASLLKFKIGTGQPADLGPFEDLEARKAKWNFIAGGPGPFGGPQQQGQQGMQQQGAGFNTMPGPIGDGTQTYAAAGDAPAAKEVTGRMGGYAPIGQQNQQAQNYAEGRPSPGPASTLWDSYTPEQRQRWQMIDPEEAQRLQAASEAEKEKLSRDRQIEETEFQGLDSALDNFYKESNFVGAEWDIPKKELYKQSRGMNQVEAQKYVKNQLTDIARDNKSIKTISQSPDHSTLYPKEKHMKEYQRIAKKGKDRGLEEYYRGKIADIFPTDFTIDQVMNPLDDDIKKALGKVKGGNQKRTTQAVSALLGGLPGIIIGNQVYNNFAELDESDEKAITNSLLEGVPKGQSLYAYRQELAPKGIAPRAFSDLVRKLQDEGKIQLNSRQSQELNNVGQTDAEHLTTEKIVPWFDGLGGLYKNVASYILGH